MVLFRYSQSNNMPILDPCETLDCANATDTCREGKCYCGNSSNLHCDARSQFPLCSEGSCICSKSKKGYEIGDGNTQGSCTSSLHKCQSDGMCAECTYDSECTGLSNKCVKRICVCGDASGRPCNSTISNVCDSGVCMCGDNPECGQTLQDIVIRQYGEDGCDEYKCSFDRSYSTCKQSRGSEVCEKITTFYNPLYIEGEFGSDGTPLNFTCDDEKGKYLGTYQCLGNA